jgi:predicted transcriptional regulator
MAKNGNLTKNQARAVAALMTTRTIEQAAQRVGIGRRTLDRWLKEDTHFQAALVAAEGQAIDAASRRLVHLADQAISVILHTMAEKATTPGVRLRAAETVLAYTLKMRELASLERRVVAIERRLEGTKDIRPPKATPQRR